MKEQLLSLYEYGDWVNQRLLDAAGVLTEEQFKRKVFSSFGSLHLTLVHILGAEVLWFGRWQGLSPTAILSTDTLPGLTAIRGRWADLMEERRAGFAHLDEANLVETVPWTNMRGQKFSLPRWQLILHGANHSTHHRSEATAIMTELGHEPESTDLLEYYLARAGQHWKPSKLP